jgi:hypothetical protein
MDLYYLFRLFIGDGELDDLGAPDLEAAFRASAEAGGPVRPPLDAVIDALAVRTRSGGRRVAGSSLPLDRPRVQPVAVRYDLEHGGPGLARILDGIRRLDLSAYGVMRAGRTPAGGELVRFGLVKRLESSVAAFSMSARALRRYFEAFADAATAGFWLAPAVHRAFTAGNPGQLLLAPLALPRLPPGFDPDRLAASAMADAGLLREMADRLDLTTFSDHKVTVLAAILQADLADRRVLVFTEFRDTALHLWKVLRPELRVGLIHGSRALLGDQPASRLEVVRRFAPLANGAAVDPIDRVDVLIATDVLAEGFNLQDAADVVSYDLPWNPVRLIQRIGRIDRAGSPHRLVRCHNFIPERTLDLYLGLVDRIGAKLDTIRAGPGRTGLHGAFAAASPSGRARSHAARDVADLTSPRWATSTRVFASSIGGTSTLRRSPGAVTSRLESRGRPASLAGTGLLRRLADEDPGLFDEFEQAADPTAGLGEPARTRDPPDSGSGYVWIVAVARGARPLRLVMVRPSQGRPDVRSDRLAASHLLEAIRSGRAAAKAWVPASTDLPTAAMPEGCWRASAAALAALDCGDAGPGTTNGRRGAAIRRFLRLVSREPGRPEPRLIDRADRLVTAMRGGLRTGVEAAIASSISRAVAELRWRPGRTARLVDELESIVGSAGHQPDPGGSFDAGPDVVAVLELLAPLNAASET